MDSEVSKIGSLFLARLRDRGRERAPLCVVLGAGADVSSGGMTFAELKRACLEQFRPTPAAALLDTAELDLQFELLLKENDTDSQRAAIVEFIFHGFEAGTPSDGYKLLVLLAREGVIDAVVTTNLDNLLEIAQNELRLDVFQIFAPGVASPFTTETDRIYLPQRPIYIKLHGDIKAKLITHIAKADIQGRKYMRSFSLLLRKIFSSHTLVFVGYSGFDEIFAQEVLAVSGKIPQPVYWCNKAAPDPDAPLVRALGAADIRFVNSTFEAIFTEGSVTCLSAASLLETGVQFVAPLIRERFRQINDRFLEGFAYPSSTDRMKLLIPRKAVAERIAIFRANTDKPLAILTGASGVGKSTMLAQLCDSSSHPDSHLIVIRAKSIVDTDFAKDLVVRLGYSSESPLALLYQFSGWLRNRGERLMVAVDALNEFSPSTSECLTLLREIVRASLWFQHHGSISVLVTIRPESWNEISSFMDMSDLAKALWSETEFKDAVNAIHLGKFGEAEFHSAYNAYARHYSVQTTLRQIHEPSRQLLSDPFLLAITMQNRKVITPQSSIGYDIYWKAHQELLKRSFGYSGSQKVELGLARIATTCLSRRNAGFFLRDLNDAGLDQDSILKLQELNIIAKLGGVDYSFAHDRVHEAYLVTAINELSIVQITGVDDLVRALEDSGDYPRLNSALRQCFAHPPPNRVQHFTRTIFDALSLSFSPQGLYPEQSRRALLEFSKDTIMVIAADAPERFVEIARGTLTKEFDGSFENISRILLHACCLLSPQRAIPLMLLAARSKSAIIRDEALILLYDKIVGALLEAADPKGLLLSEDIRSFLLGQDASPGRKIIRILGIVAQIGPDNTHPAEWERIRTAISDVLDMACAEAVGCSDLLSDLPEMIAANANRYLFNAGDDVLEQFFMSRSRLELMPIFDQLEAGAPLTLPQIVCLRPLVSVLGKTFEFVICNLLFLMSMKIDQARTLDAFEAYFLSFDGNTNPEEIDFFLSALCISHLSLGLNFQDSAAVYTERILTELQESVLKNPGIIRGRRRFSDHFDQQFEDGFNPLAFYFYNAPSERRRTQGHSEYIKAPQQEEDLLPLYWRFLREFESRGQLGGTLRVVHALGQMISLWPIEGLQSIRKLLGRTEPIIRRAIIRVLAEAYARFPAETMLLISESGGAFSDTEKHAIKCGLDPRLSERSFEQLHWARVLFFLDNRDASGRFISRLTEALISNVSFPEALAVILEVIAQGTDPEVMGSRPPLGPSG